MKAKVVRAYGTRNRYECDLCQQSIVTEDQDEGTTPFMLRCRATAACAGTMRSVCYSATRVGDGPATFIWRKPTPEEYLKASHGMKEHFDMGGLEIHPISPPSQGK